jgi:hypothetical protein
MYVKHHRYNPLDLKINWLMLFREIISVYFEKNIKPSAYSVGKIQSY